MPICRYLSRIHAADPVVCAAPSSPKMATDSTAFLSVKTSEPDHWKSGKSRFHGSFDLSCEARGGVPQRTAFLAKKSSKRFMAVSFSRFSGLPRRAQRDADTLAGSDTEHGQVLCRIECERRLRVRLRQRFTRNDELQARLCVAVRQVAHVKPARHLCPCPARHRLRHDGFGVEVRRGILTSVLLHLRLRVLHLLKVLHGVFV